MKNEGLKTFIAFMPVKKDCPPGDSPRNISFTVTL
jgi:hypothetical protein